MLNVLSLQLVLVGSVCFAWMVLGLVLHEAAHATVARWAGFEPQEIVIGQGPFLFTADYLGVPMRFHLLPVGGLTVTRPREGGPLGRRRALFPAAGVGTDLILLLVLVGLAARFHPGNFGFSPFVSLGKVTAYRWQGYLGWLLILQALRFLGNLIPRNIRGAHGLMMPSDGRQVLRYLSGKEVTYRFEDGAASVAEPRGDS